jgi:hypothetical protein
MPMGDSLREHDLPRLAAWGEQCVMCDLAELCRDVPVFGQGGAAGGFRPLILLRPQAINLS